MATVWEWVKYALRPSNAFRHVEIDTTFDGAMGYEAREWLWLPLKTIVTVLSVIYATWLWLLVGYPMHWFSIVRAALAGKRAEG